MAIAVSVGLFVIPMFTSPTYLAHNINCSLSGETQSVQPTAECNSTPVQLRTPPGGATLPFNSIFWSFRVTRATTFTIDFHANESLVVVLRDVTTGGLIVQFDQSNLATAMYQLGPANYSLVFSNQNSAAVGFTLDAYVPHGAIAPN